MHHLLATAPGTLNLNGESIRILPNTTISVEDTQLAAVLSQHSFLALVYSDPKPELVAVPELVATDLPLQLELELAPATLLTSIPKAEEPEVSQPISTVKTGGGPTLEPVDDVPPMDAINPLAYTNLPVGASAMEALTYLQELANLPSCPVALVVTTGNLYPHSKKVADLVKKILKDQAALTDATPN
jgi:hypothetical protein